MKLLRVFAVLFALLAVSNFLKPILENGETGFVFLGRRLAGPPNLIAAWTFMAFLVAYAVSLWRERAAALPLGIAYACYVTANLYLFTMRTAPPTGNAKIFGIVFTVLALAGSWGVVALMIRDGFASRDSAPGRILLRAFALLFALMALSDAIKPFAYTADVGFVLFGQRQTGMANTVAALVFASLLATYAASIWQEKRLALTLGAAYAAYVIANLVLWNFRKPPGTELPLSFIVPYLFSAVGVSNGAALLLWRHRERLT
ncbi:MAG TPA: hypothetical protein VGK20_01780 [Candidatus Binatia bacterium]|jgi:hypothetical protein